MTVSIMQPYFLPYLGYFQLINAADRFVVYDTIQYSKQGWMNRNRMLLNGKDAFFTLPVRKDSDFLYVEKRALIPDFEKHATYLHNLFFNAYRKAPFVEETLALIDSVLFYPESNLFAFLMHSIEAVCRHLEITTPLIKASVIPADHSRKGVDRVIDITLAIGGTVYRNPNGAAWMYHPDYFASRGLGLEILKMNAIEYPQFGNRFVPSLSILDVLMFNGKERTKELLNEFSLLEHWETR
jgi:hypothetical protein